MADTGKTLEDRLSALDEATNEIGAKPPKRLAWRIEWDTNESGRVVNVMVKPVVQLPRADGWSRGKHMALCSIRSEPKARITERDRAIADSIYYHKHFGVSEIYVLRTLSYLAGHPFLFRMDSDDKVEIRHEHAALSVTESDGVCLIKRYGIFEQGRERADYIPDGFRGNIRADAPQREGPVPLPAVREMAHANLYGDSAGYFFVRHI